MDTPGDRIAFDGFVFDPATGDLGRPEGHDTRLPPKPARLLELLLERPGELVAREDLVAQLWPGQHLDVEQALAYTVRQVRLALGDEANEPRFIETLPRRGYRFVGQIGGSRPSPEAHRRQPRRRVAVAVGVLLVASVALGALAWWGLERSAGANPTRVALLPLVPPERLAADDDALAANDRLDEPLLVALTARPELDVVGPATTAPLRGTRRPQTEIGRELQVEFVISGGYAPDERILFLQMVRTSDGGHLFARRIEGTEEAVVDRLGGVVAEMVAIADRPIADREPPVSLPPRWLFDRSSAERYLPVRKPEARLK
jgi:DNA-binding winged helix-turn-helix (wHTH) protein/TolB-like protein